MNDKISVKTRDLYIDFFRGGAVLAILLHHTVFWTGDIVPSPNLLRNVSRLLEVPLFVYLSGWSAKYSHRLDKVFMNLIKIWLKWILFISLTDLIYFVVIKSINITSPIQWVYQCYYNTDASWIPLLPVLPASMWFMPMFIALELLGSCFLMFKDRLNIEDRNIYYVILFLMIGLSYLNLINGDSWFLLSRNMCFYGIMYLVGYLSNDLINKKFRFYFVVLLIDLLCWFLSGKLFGIAATDLVSVKFPPHIMYLFASLICVIVCISLHGRMNSIVEKLKPIRFIGRNSLSFYFSQGIACSVPYMYVQNNPHIVEKYSWKTILPVALLFNVVVGVSIGSIFSYLFLFIERQIKKVNCKINK